MTTAMFLKQALVRPKRIGAVLPSSRYLAAAMASEASGAGLLVELGAGTGAVTQVLRETCPDAPLVAAEIDSDLAWHLHLRFPGVDVRATQAHRLIAELRREALPAETVIVSSLPFRSLPRKLHARTVDAVCNFLEEDPTRRLVQYTYQPRRPFSLPEHSRLLWRWRRTVWRNVPPAGVWVLQRTPEADGEAPVAPD